PELKRFYAAVPKHFVLTPPRHTANIQADLVQELDSKQGAVKPILSNLIVEEARLMVFDYMPSATDYANSLCAAKSSSSQRVQKAYQREPQTHEQNHGDDLVCIGA